MQLLEPDTIRWGLEAAAPEAAASSRSAPQLGPQPTSRDVDLADTGLGDRTADLPDDEGLVDVAGGTAVRWVEGQGWVKESA